MGKNEIRRERALRKRKTKRLMEIGVAVSAALAVAGWGYLAFRAEDNRSGSLVSVD